MIVPGRLLRGAAVAEREVEGAAVGELACLLAVELLPGRGALRHVGRAGGDAAGDLVLLDEGVAGAGVEIDADRVAGHEPGEAAARRAFGRRVEDRGAVR